MFDRSTINPATDVPNSTLSQMPPGSMATSPVKSIPRFPSSVTGSVSDGTAVSFRGFLPSSQQPLQSVRWSSSVNSTASFSAVSVAASNVPSFIGTPSSVFLSNFPQPKQAATASSSTSDRSAAGVFPSANVAGNVNITGGHPAAPVILPPVVPQSGGATAALGSGMADLAEMERILQENPQLTQQVTALIVKQYPLYSANPLMLRFAVCHELKLLQKIRAEQGLPSASAIVSQPLPSSGTDQVSATSMGDPDANGATANCLDSRRSSADR